MARVHLQRARYRPKLPVIHYVSQQRVLVRARPRKVRNPRTESQQRNRGKMSVASHFLSHFQSFVVSGFQPGAKPNGRPVGAYHIALGHLLNGAMRQENGQWSVDYAHVELSQGQSLRDFPLRVGRSGRGLRFFWLEGLPEGTRSIRVAVYNAAQGESLSLVVHAPKRGKSVEVILPKGMRAKDLHVWWSPTVAGKARWGSRYIFLAKGEKAVVGWMVARKRVEKGIPSQYGRNLHRAPRGGGGMPPGCGEVGGRGGG